MALKQGKSDRNVEKEKTNIYDVTQKANYHDKPKEKYKDLAGILKMVEIEKKMASSCMMWIEIASIGCMC